MSATKTKQRPKEITADDFEAMSPEAKEKIFRELENETSQSRLARSKPLSKKERAEWNEWKRRRGGRPQVGKGSKMVGVTIERELLKQADKYAKANGLKRTELIAKSLRAMIGIAS